MDDYDMTMDVYGGITISPAWRRPSHAQIGRRAAIQNRMRQLEAELAELAKYGDDVYEDGDILVFRFRFNSESNPEIWYSYAALKCGSYWYLTGPQHGSKKTWDELVAFWASGRLLENTVNKVKSTKTAIEF